MEGMQKTSEGKTSFLLMCANPRARTHLHPASHDQDAV